MWDAAQGQGVTGNRGNRVMLQNVARGPGEENRRNRGPACQWSMAIENCTVSGMSSERFGLLNEGKSGTLLLWVRSSISVIRGALGSRPQTKEEASSSSERNLKLQLAIPRHLRRGRVRSFASGMNSNPRLWKYRWKIFVIHPEDSPSKEHTFEMPEMTHAKFQKHAAWLQDQGIEFSVSNTRQRREHQLWNAETVASECLAPAYEKDRDPVASDGHR